MHLTMIGAPGGQCRPLALRCLLFPVIVAIYRVTLFSSYEESMNRVDGPAGDTLCERRRRQWRLTAFESDVGVHSRSHARSCCLSNGFVFVASGWWVGQDVRVMAVATCVDYACSIWREDDCNSDVVVLRLGCSLRHSDARTIMRRVMRHSVAICIVADRDILRRSVFF